MVPIIADTSGLYAAVDQHDPNHRPAAAFLRSLPHEQRRLLVSNHVFDEAMTLVKIRLGLPAALQLGMRLRASRLVDLVVFGPEEESLTWQLFGRYKDKAWSYTDCACLALAQHRGIRQAFSFDRHFHQMGLEVLP